MINPDKKFFTWHQGNKRSRLDYIFISEHLLNYVEDSGILPAIQSDHSRITLSLKTGNEATKGRGFWKFNSSLLHDQNYVRDLTRQHSTQSVGNMPPPSPRHLLPHVLQIMPRNPKYDQFQPKGHHNEENPQITTKMP